MLILLVYVCAAVVLTAAVGLTIALILVHGGALVSRMSCATCKDDPRRVPGLRCRECGRRCER